jgi:hypothetical protein
MRVNVDSQTGESRLVISNPEGEARFSLVVGDRGRATLEIGDDAGPRVLVVVDDGAAYCEATDGSKASVRIGAVGEAATLALRAKALESDGMHEIMLSAWPKGSKVELSQNGSVAAQLGAHADGSGLILRDGKGTERVKLLSVANGGTGLALYGEDGKQSSTYGLDESKSGGRNNEGNK